jgi:hypothetical protein
MIPYALTSGYVERVLASTFAAIDDNELSGSLNSEMLSSWSPTIRKLHMNRNRFRGSLPSELGLLTHATEIFLDDNFLSGTIPTELGRMTSVEKLFLQFNYLTGTIPSEL